jgi:hypothetical protein
MALEAHGMMLIRVIPPFVPVDGASLVALTTQIRFYLVLLLFITAINSATFVIVL